VADSAVIAVPDDHNGELPKAFLTLKQPRSPPSAEDARSIKEDIDQFVRKQKAPYK
jgi:acyl-coenzyme A synthetase/AMP-(fatty) acid ligase